VLENILRKKRKTAKELEDKAKSQAINKKVNHSKRIKKEIIILPEQFIRKYKANQTSYQRFKKRVFSKIFLAFLKVAFFLKKNKLGRGKLEKIPDEKTLILIRIRGFLSIDFLFIKEFFLIKSNTKISPRILSILKSLKLKEIHSAVFVKSNEKTSEKIKLIEPYITYGFFSLIYS